MHRAAVHNAGLKKIVGSGAQESRYVGVGVLLMHPTETRVACLHGRCRPRPTNLQGQCCLAEHGSAAAVSCQDL